MIFYLVWSVLTTAPSSHPYGGGEMGASGTRDKIGKIPSRSRRPEPCPAGVHSSIEAGPQGGAGLRSDWLEAEGRQNGLTIEGWHPALLAGCRCHCHYVPEEPLM